MSNLNLANLNWVDYVLLTIFVLSILVGMKRGLIKELISIIALIAAFIIASMFAAHLASYFTSTSSVQNLVNQSTSFVGADTTQPISYFALGVSYAVLFFATIIVGAIISYILQLGVEVTALGFINRILGGGFGLIRGYLINLVIIFVVQLTSLGTEPWWAQSKLVVAYQPSVVWLGKTVSPVLSNIDQRVNILKEQASGIVG